MSNFIEFKKRIDTRGGATFNIGTGQIDFDKGFGVSLEEHEQVFVKDDFEIKDIANFVLQKARIINLIPNLELGGWVSGDKVYLDLTEVIKDKAEAITKAIKRNQLAIFDFENKEVIDIPPIQKTGTLTQQESHKKLIIKKLLS
tara:strand:+ start:738 stop:1169 length:432 start_codon:yes stop_codon:yes gene_type:complete